MNIYKVSIISGIETVIKLVAGFLVLKMLAFNAGPEGVGKFGQFQNFLSIIVVLVSGGFVTGLVRFVSEEANRDELAGVEHVPSTDYIKGAFTFGFFASTLICVFLILAAENLSLYIFDSNGFEVIFYLLAPGLFLIVIYQVSIAYLNGVRLIRAMVYIKLVASFSLLIIGVGLIYFYGLYGGLVGLMCMQMVGGAFAIKVFLSLPSFSWEWLKPCFNKKIQSDLSSYWLMSLMSLISTALVMMLIRKHVVLEGSWVIAGLWEATSKLSELSLLVVTTALTVYYVPMLSKSSAGVEQISLLLKVTLLALVAAVIISGVVYFFREFFIVTLFSEQFLSISEVVKFQLVGGLFKIVGWVIGFHMLIKSKPAVFIMAELVFGLILYVLSIFLFDLYGLLGLTYAFLANNVLFCLFGATYLSFYFKEGSFVNG